VPIATRATRQVVDFTQIDFLLTGLIVPIISAGRDKAATAHLFEQLPIYLQSERVDELRTDHTGVERH